MKNGNVIQPSLLLEGGISGKDPQWRIWGVGSNGTVNIVKQSF